MTARDGFAHCPRCAAPGLAFVERRHACTRCGWTFFRNAVAAALAILEHEDGVVLVQRAREPAAGTWDLPGGFLDLGETAEAGLARELREELGITCTAPRYLGSYPNVYPYGGVTYHTLDLCFHVRIDAPPARTAMDRSELAGLALVPRERIDLDTIGFESPRRALADFLGRT